MGGHIVHLDKIRSLYQLLQLSHRDPVETTQLLLAELLSLLIFLLLRKDNDQFKELTLAFVLSVLYKQLVWAIVYSQKKGNKIVHSK